MAIATAASVPCLGFIQMSDSFGDFGIVGCHGHGLRAFVAHLGKEVGIGRAGLGHVGAPGDDVSRVVPVGRFGHVGLLARDLRAGRWQVAIPVVKAITPANQAQVAAARCIETIDMADGRSR